MDEQHAAVDAAGAVEYAPESIVSKTIAEHREGTLTLFAFDAGQGLSEHTTPFDATILVLDGCAEVRIDRDVHRVDEGALIRLPAGVPHAVQARERFKMLLIMIRARAGASA